jgi:glycosyltransferase involved in cell wall biosynthesis
LAQHGIEAVEAPFMTPALEALLGTSGRIPAKLARTLQACATYPMRNPRVNSFDGVLVYREAAPIGPPLLERRIKGPMIYDIDDPIFLGSMAGETLIARVRARDKWRKCCERADLVISINEDIAAFVRPHCHRVVVIPNAVDLAAYPVRSPDVDRVGEPVIGFSGSRTTMPQLGLLAEPLATLATNTRFKLATMGGPVPFALPHAAIVEHQWTAESEIPTLGTWDIAVSPAVDDEWNSYKEYLKVVVYMAAGLPVVASPVGSARRLVVDGHNGFLARTAPEWVEALATLVEDPALRRRMGAAARRTIEENFTVQQHYPRLLEHLRAVLSMPEAPEVSTDRVRASAT